MLYDIHTDQKTVEAAKLWENRLILTFSRLSPILRSTEARTWGAETLCGGFVFGRAILAWVGACSAGRSPESLELAGSTTAEDRCFYSAHARLRSSCMSFTAEGRDSFRVLARGATSSQSLAGTRLE